MLTYFELYYIPSLSMCVFRQLFEAMDRDEPKDTEISLPEFVYYYNAYEDYVRDAFSGFCPPSSASYTSEQLQQAEWYHQTEDGGTEGPLEFAQLKKAFEGGVVEPSTYVWCEEIDEWLEVSGVSGLVELLSA